MKKIKLLLCLLMLTSLCGCSSNDSSSKTLNAAMFWISTSLDPTNNYDGWVLSRIGVGETLLKLNEKYEVEPSLAKSYEQIDDTTWKFTLNNSVTFSNGKKVTGKHVQQCLERAFKNNTRAVDYFDLNHIESKGQEVYLYLNKPSGALLNNLCEPLFTIYDASQSDEDIASHPICTGPFVVDDFVSEKTIETSRNENYYDGKAKLDHVHFTQVSDSDARVLALQSKEVDLANTIDYSSLKLFRKNKDYQVLEVLGPRTNVVYMNNESTFLNDKIIRQALSYSVDRESIVKLIGGKVAQGLYSSALPYGHVLNGYTFDLAKANALLNEAGYLDSNHDGIREKDGQKLTIKWLTYPSRQELPLLAEAAQSTLKEIGMDVQINATADHNSIWKDTSAWDVYVGANVNCGLGDPTNFFSTHCLDASTKNRGQYHSDKLEELAVQLNSTFDTAKRNQIAIEMQQQLLDDNAFVFCSFLKMSMISQANVTGLTAHACDYYELTADLDIN